MRTTAAAFIIAATGLPFASATAQPVSPEVAGVYEITVKPDSSDNPCGLEETVNIGSFGQDGTLVNVDPLLGTSVGRIYKGPGQVYYSTFFGIAFNPIVQQVIRYEVQGVSTRSSEDRFEGTFSTTVTAPVPIFPTGTTCTSTGTFTGQRLAGSRL